MASFTASSAVQHCKCKSSCSFKQKQNTNRGCPCKGSNIDCSAACKCGTRAKPCKNKKAAANSEGESGGTPTNTRAGRMNQQGFRLTHEPRETEERQREKENKDVKV
ncbi:P2X purinoceptor 7-like [Paramuricea clavata]|uniref:P2X purinoceptor 7-like n=1 Tax=Paramuricea clavata TaxID=317549 RepID=A0A6S7GAQ4_PARCT|nr:P2X purinoceptor 7-like [Paramuricea clavata]